MGETVNPTDLEFWDALLNVDNDPYAAQAEVLRRLQINLPMAIDKTNAQNGWSGSDAIIKPAKYHIAPADFNDDVINTVSVGLSVQDVAFAPQLFKTVASIVVYSVEGKRLETASNVRAMWGRARAIRGVLHYFLTGCRNAEDVLCWRLLTPDGVSLLQSDVYWGTVCKYHLVQVPGA